MKRIVLLVLQTGVIFSLSAQVDTSQLKKLFAQYDAHQKVMAAACLYQNGEFIYNNAIGFSDIAKNKKSNIYTQYRIGSITKIFTAVMILQLIEEGKLALDTRLSKFYPGIPNSDKITIEHLLRHRSGIYNFTADVNFVHYRTKTQSEGELLKIISGFKSDFLPGSKYSYSNSNYVLLGFMIEKICKTDYSTQLLKRICSRALLGDTKVGSHIHTERNEALSYKAENNQWVPVEETDMSIPHGAGCIVSTARDLCFFIESLFEGKLISKTMLGKMMQMQDNYGFGLVRFQFGEKWFYGHNGGIDGFESTLAYNPEDSLAICILGNGFNYPINHVAIALLNAAYHFPFEIPDFAPKQSAQENKYSMEGVYRNSKMDMKITISSENGNLSAQATGQESFPLDKVSDLLYEFELAGIQIQFKKNPDNSIPGFILKQGGADLLFERE